jgi:hypothetical protein
LALTIFDVIQRQELLELLHLGAVLKVNSTEFETFWQFDHFVGVTNSFLNSLVLGASWFQHLLAGLTAPELVTVNQFDHF